MKRTLKHAALALFFIFLSCGGNEPEKEEKSAVKLKKEKSTVALPEKSDVKASETIDLTNKGIGPIKSLELPETIDQAMVLQGEEVYNKMCLACHQIGKKFIGPPPNGILERRTPEWIMNMILDPDGMTRNDPLAKALLIEFNGSPMANQNLTEEEARSILEYFRTLK